MSRAPFVMGKATEAVLAPGRGVRHHHRLALRQPADEGSSTASTAMPETAENVAAEYQVSRADQDAFAFRSQQRAGQGRGRRLPRPRDHPGRDARRTRQDRRRSTRTSIRARDHARGAGQAEDAVPQARHRHRRQRVRRQRRRGGADPRQRGRGQGARPDAARARHSAWRRPACRRASWASARRPSTAKLMARLGLKIERFRRHRTQRGVRRARPRRTRDARPARRQRRRQPERRRHRARPSARHVAAPGLSLTAVNQLEASKGSRAPRHHVRRRRPRRQPRHRSGSEPMTISRQRDRRRLLLDARRTGRRIAALPDRPEAADARRRLRGAGARYSKASATASPATRSRRCPDGPNVVAPILASLMVWNGATRSSPRTTNRHRARVRLPLQPRRSPPTPICRRSTRPSTPTVVTIELCDTPLHLARRPQQARELIADFFSNRGAVPGTAHPVRPGTQLQGRQMSARFRRHRQQRAHRTRIRTAIRCSRWRCCRRRSATAGYALKAGHFVITGSLTGITWVDAPLVVEGQIDGFGKASVKLTG